MKHPSRIGATGRRVRTSPRQPAPDRAEAGQILFDHRYVDLFVLDRTGVPVGRPFVACTLDSSTRQVIGFGLSFEPPCGGG